MSISNQELAGLVNLDPTVPAPMANVAEYGFEGRFEDWADDARYFEYSKAANPIGSGHVPQVPIVQFGPEIYQDQPTGVVPLDLSQQLGIKTGEATSPALLANFVRIRAGEQIDTCPNATSQLYYVLHGRGFAAVDGRLAEDDLAVGGDGLPGADDEAVTHAQRGHRAAALEPQLVDHGDLFGPHRGERAQRVARPLPGPRLEIAPGQHEGRHAGGHVEVDRPGRAVHQHEENGLRHPARVAPEHCVQRPHGGGHDAN